LDQWAYDNQVTLDFSRTGKPTDKPYIEFFNGSFRDECLNLLLVPVTGRCKEEDWSLEARVKQLPSSQLS